MIKIFIQTIGKERSRGILALQSEYIKRLPWKIIINEYQLPFHFIEISKIKKAESDLLLTNLPNNSIVMLLDEYGKENSSIEFANLMNKSIDDGYKNFVFLIGGAHGHSDELKRKSYQLISLSKMTFPHKLIRLILIEQLYRAYTIIKGHPYHKD